MKQIVITVVVALIGSVLGALLAFSLLKKDPADEMAKNAPVVDQPVINEPTGQQGENAGSKNPLVYEQQPAPVPEPVVSQERPVVDEADYAEPTSDDAVVTGGDISGAGVLKAEESFEASGTAVADEVADSEASNPVESQNAAASVVVGSDAYNASDVPAIERAQNAVNSPGISLPNLNKNYGDGRQFHPSAIQDYYGRQNLPPKNPVDEEKATYYQDNRERMKEAIKNRLQ